MPKILYLEDDAFICMDIKDALSRRGIEVDDYVAPNRLPQNIDWKNSGYDLILTDNRMPGENGVDFARRVRESGGNLPIILLSSDDLHNIQQHAPDFEDLNVEFIKKGVTIDALAEKIKSQNHRRQRGDIGHPKS